MPKSASAARRRLCAAYGARIVETDPLLGSDGALERVRALVAAAPGRYFYADQYRNPANPLAHYRGTGPEIWDQTDGRVTHFVASAGTGGTITGVGRYLKEQNPDVRIVGLDPEGSKIGPFFNTGELIEGHPYKVEGIGNDKIPGALEKKIVSDLGSVAKMKEDFAQAGVTQFGSGWCWLAVKDGKIVVMKTANGESPLVHGASPILGCDVWEHSYYIDYRNRRPDYLKAFVDHLVNWDYVAEMYEKAAK